MSEAREEMLELLMEEFPEMDAVDVECAVYWYCADHHGGQTSALYEVLSESPYEPGRFEPDETSKQGYDFLIQSYGDKGP